MKIAYDVKLVAQNDLGRTWAVIQTVEHENGDIDRNNIFESQFKNNKGLLDCNKVLQKIKFSF